MSHGFLSLASVDVSKLTLQEIAAADGATRHRPIVSVTT